MATTNPFDLLVDDDNDDLSQLIAAKQQKLAAAPSPASAPVPAPKKGPATAQTAAHTNKLPAGNKLVSKPAPPAQAVREARNDFQRGGGHGAGRGGPGRGRGGPGRGRGGREFGRESANGDNSYGTNNGFSGGYRPPEDGDAGKPSERRGPGGFRGSRRGGYSNGDVAEGEHPRRQYERHSGTVRGNELKRDVAGHGNGGLPEVELSENQVPVKENEKEAEVEKQVGQEDSVDANKESPVNEPEEKEPEPEDKEMTLDEYEKVFEEKRKALLALKTEERKVGLDKELESMQQLANKKNDEDVFIKLGSEKDKRKEAAEKEERARKAVSINEFLKPADGETYYRLGGRGRGRGRGRGGYGGSSRNNVEAPSIEDVGQFPSLGGK